jgi:hypothetical protein
MPASRAPSAGASTESSGYVFQDEFEGTHIFPQFLFSSLKPKLVFLFPASRI